MDSDPTHLTVQRLMELLSNVDPNASVTFTIEDYTRYDVETVVVHLPVQESAGPGIVELIG